jgi:choice-of-anchor B domain-containing protein
MLRSLPLALPLARSAALASTLVGALLVPTAAAHDSAEFMHQRQAPAAGPVVLQGGAGGSPVYASSGVALLAWLPLSSFAGAHTSGADCWGYTSPSGREYAIIGLSDGVGFVEITDPGMPVVLTTLPAVNSGWRDIKIYQDHAYHVSEGGDGVQIVDLSLIDAGIVTPVGSVNDAGTTASHNVAIDTDAGFLYQLGGGGTPVEGMRIYSLANKAAPAFVGEWDDRYIHDAQIVTYTSGPWSGKQIAFCFSENESGGGAAGLDILDVTNKGSIQSLYNLSYSSPVFSHQGWLSPDRQYLYINDELDEATFGTPTTTRVIDVANLNAPFQAGTFTSGKDAVDHNLYTKGGLIFEANYRSGLRVFDAGNPAAPVETAFFDTYPADDAAAFNGLWNAYPYFPSDTVIGSDIERGLFVWRLGAPGITLTPAALPELIGPFGDAIDVAVGAAPGVFLEPGSPTLHLDAGAGFVALPLSDLGGGTWRANFPALPCGAELRWYLSARSTAGVTFHAPAGAPAALYGANAASSVDTLLSEDLESNPGWIVGATGDDADTGIWTRVNPVGTAAQPEDDHTPGPGTDCYVTGQGSIFGSLGDDDVDGGRTTLRTAVFSLASGDATVRYWRWYSNQAGSSPGEDVFVVDISNNAGGSWTNVEVVGPTGDDTLGGWIQHGFVVSDFVAPTSQMQLRFVASDEDDGSIIEAAIDDFEVVRFECSQVCQTDLGFGGPGSATLSVCGEPLSAGNSATLLLEQAAPNRPATLFVSLGFTPLPFKGGTFVTVPILLNIALVTDSNGEINLVVPGNGAPVSVYVQFAISDPGQPAGVALSNALEIQFGP